MVMWANNVPNAAAAANNLRAALLERADGNTLANLPAAVAAGDVILATWILGMRQTIADLLNLYAVKFVELEGVSDTVVTDFDAWTLQTLKDHIADNHQDADGNDMFPLSGGVHNWTPDNAGTVCLAVQFNEVLWCMRHLKWQKVANFTNVDGQAFRDEYGAGADTYNDPLSDYTKSYASGSGIIGQHWYFTTGDEPPDTIIDMTWRWRSCFYTLMDNLFPDLIQISAAQGKLRVTVSHVDGTNASGGLFYDVTGPDTEVFDTGTLLNSGAPVTGTVTIDLTAAQTENLLDSGEDWLNILVAADREIDNTKPPLDDVETEEVVILAFAWERDDFAWT
jgi:hypothetical protein